MTNHYFFMKMTFMIIGKMEALEEAIAHPYRPLTVPEAAKYLDCSVSHLYKLIHWEAIPYSKKNNKRIFFDRRKLDQWMLDNPVKSRDEIEREAENHLQNLRRNKK